MYFYQMLPSAATFETRGWIPRFDLKRLERDISPNSKRNCYHSGMAKNAPAPTSNTQTPPATGKPFTGIKRRPVKILKPGTVDPTETMRRLRGR
jgi:hypothetical protein